MDEVGSKPDTNVQNDTLVFRVGDDELGIRLDAYLAARIEGWSRARLQRLIEDEDVLVNARTAKPSHKLQPNDEIEVELIAPALTRFTPENIALSILYEDPELVVLDKPAGMVVHPAAGVHSGTLANALAYHFERLSNQAGIRPGIVHRLDKDTSGLMVVAKTESTHEALADQFRERQVFKSYVALVHGVVSSNSGRIDQPIARDPKNRTRMAVVAGGRQSVSIYKVRQRFNAFTLLDVELKTGRTHQIRVHLSWLKHPVVGDEIYGGGRDNTVRDASLRAQIRKLGRHFLHAEQLGFTHPKTGEAMRFTSELPVKLSSLLSALE